MSGSTTFKVSEAVGPLGTVPVVKQAIDVRKVIVDFSRWLDAGETISLLSNFAIEADPSSSYPSWQTDFPFVTPTSPAPADTNPLLLSGATILAGSTKAQLLIGAGTPGLAYVLSFLVTVAPSQRQKEIDLLVSVNQAVNSAMISSTTPPTQTITVVAATAVLPVGTAGSVYLENGTSAAITVTLPPTPVAGQRLDFIDVSLNAGLYAITLQGASGALIDGSATLALNANGIARSLEWSGAQWSIL